MGTKFYNSGSKCAKEAVEGSKWSIRLIGRSSTVQRAWAESWRVKIT